MFWRKKFIPRNAESISWAKEIYVGGIGPLPSRLMAVGQCPGFGEATASPPAPFQESAPAGGELNVYLQQAGLKRDEFYITNAYPYFLVDHFGSDRPPTHTELESHWPILEGEIATCEPRIIVCLGAVALRWIMEKAGLEYHSSDCHRGQAVGYYGKSLVFSCQHPASGVHSQDNMKFLVADFTNLARTVRVINRGDRVTLPVDDYAGIEDYRRMFTTQDIDDVWDAAAPFISIDTEGTKKHPIMLQFSFLEGTGYAIYAKDAELITHFRRKLGEFLVRNSIHTGGQFCFLHNALYDIGVMASDVLGGMHIHLPDGSWIDTMVCAFLLGTEPLGLKPLSFRHRGMKMQSYDEQIGPRNEEMALDYLMEAVQYDWPAAQEMVIREGPDYRLYKPQSIGVRINKILRDWAEQDVKIEHVTHVEAEETNKAGVTKTKRHTHDWFEKRHGRCPEGCHEVKVEREKPVDIRDRWYKKGESIEFDAESEDGDDSAGYDTTGEMLRAPVEEKLGVMKHATLLDIPEEKALAYSCRDSDATTRIGPLLLSKVNDLGLDAALKIDMGIQPIIARMTELGIPARKEHFLALGREWRERMNQIEYDIFNLAGRSINLGSGPQLAHLLFNELHLPSNRWTESREQLATDKKALEPLRFMHPVVPMVLEWGELSTLISNYAAVLPRKLDAEGRIHCKIGQTRVPSGRLNTSDPNLMAQPTRSEVGKKIRDGFYAPKGKLVVCTDLKQIELKVEADESQDKVLLNVFLSGIDGHTDTAQRMFKIPAPTDLQRAVGKTINFLIVNRGGGQALMEQLLMQKLAAPDWQAGATYVEGAILQNVKGECHRFTALTPGVAGQREPAWILSPEAITDTGSIIFQEIGTGWRKEICDDYIGGWYKDHPGVTDWHERLFAEALRTGCVRTWSGRLRWSPELRSSIPKIREAGKKQAVNLPIQGGAQDIMKIGMRLMWEEMTTGRMKNMGVEPWIQIHDDLPCAVDEAAVPEFCAIAMDVMGRRVAEVMEMEFGKKFSVPLGADCKAGKEWGTVKKIKL